MPFGETSGVYEVAYVDSKVIFSGHGPRKSE